MAVCGAILFGGATFAVIFTMGFSGLIWYGYYLGVPMAFLMECAGFAPYPTHGFLHKVVFYDLMAIIVNALLGAALFVLVGYFLQFIKHCFSAKGDQEKQ